MNNFGVKVFDNVKINQNLLLFVFSFVVARYSHNDMWVYIPSVIIFIASSISVLITLVVYTWAYVLKKIIQ